MDSNGKTVLIVEDEPDISRVTCLRLQASGYETLTAYDGLAGVEAATDHQPDAVLLDVRMPRMDGLRALTELRRREATCSIPVIMLSASLIDRPAALDAGARYFLSKPYDSRMLTVALERVTAKASGVASPHIG